MESDVVPRYKGYPARVAFWQLVYVVLLLSNEKVQHATVTMSEPEVVMG